MTRDSESSSTRSASSDLVPRIFWDARARVAVAAPETPPLYPQAAQQLAQALQSSGPGDSNAVGIAIHGPPGVGKSSLAAWAVAESGLKAAVLAGPFSFRGLVRVLLDALDQPAADDRWRLFDDSPVPGDEQEDFLVELLRSHVEAPGLAVVLDDFERLLRPTDAEPRHLIADGERLVLDLARAVRRSGAPVRLLPITRTRFRLTDRGRDDLFSVVELDLPQANEANGAVGIDLGHPALQDRLRRTKDVMPASHEAASRPMQTYLDGRQQAGDGSASLDVHEVAAFFHSLLFERLLQDMSPNRRDLLRVSTIFETPIPWPVVEELARRFDLLDGLWQEGRPGRPTDAPLVRLGFWTLLYPSEDGPPSVAIDPAAAPYAGHLDDEERPAVAMHLLQLFGDLGPAADPDGALQRCRLAVAAMDPAILGEVLPGALDSMLMDLRYEHALELARQALYLMDTSRFIPPAEILRRAGDLLLTSEDAAKGAALLRRAEATATDDDRVRAAVLRSVARASVLDSDFADALPRLLDAAERFEALGRPWDAAMTLDEAAGAHSAVDDLAAAAEIRRRELSLLGGLDVPRRKITVLGHLGSLTAALGELDAAMQYHQDALELADALPGADDLSQAVRGEIAATLAELGRFDEAMDLHRERLDFFAPRDDARARADALWSAARVELRRSRIDAATALLVDAYHLCLEDDYVEGIGRVGMDYGQVLWAAGMMGEARLILEKAVDSFRRRGATRHLAEARSILEELTTAS